MAEQPVHVAVSQKNGFDATGDLGLSASRHTPRQERKYLILLLAILALAASTSSLSAILPYIKEVPIFTPPLKSQALPRGSSPVFP